MVYDLRPSNDYNYGNQYQSKESRDQSSYSRERSTPYSRERYEQQLEQPRQVEKAGETREQKEWLDSLPVYDLEEETESASPKEQSKKQNQKQSVKNKQAKPKKSEEEEEEEEKKKKQKGDFSWLRRQDDRQKQKPKGKPKPDSKQNSQLEGQADQVQQRTRGKDQQKNSLTTNKNKPVTTAGNKQSSPAGQSTQNRASHNSNASVAAKSTSIDKSSSISAIPMEPIFIAPSVELAKTKRENIIGTRDDGSVLYISDSPSSERANVESGIGIKELSSSQANSIYSQQQSNAQLALDSVQDTGVTAQQNIGSISSGSTSQIDRELARITASTAQVMQKQKTAVAEMTRASRGSVMQKSEQNRAQIENHYSNAISAIDLHTANANQQLTASYLSINMELERTHGTFEQRAESLIASTHSTFTRQQEQTQAAILNTQRAYIQQFDKQSPNKSDNSLVKALDSINWDGYVANWRSAKKQVTQQLGQKFFNDYKSSFVDNFATLDGYRREAIGGGQKLLARNQESLREQYQQQQNAIAQQAISAKGQAAATKQQLVGSIEQRQSQQLGQIDAEEAAFLQSIDETGNKSIESITNFGTELRNGLERSIATGQENLASAVSAYESGLNRGQDFSTLVNAPASAAAAKAGIAEAEQGVLRDIESATSNGIVQIRQLGAEIDSGLAQIAPQAARSQQQSLAKYTTELQQQTGSAGGIFNAQVNDYRQSVNEKVASVQQRWQQMPTKLMSDYQTVEQNLSRQLKTAETQVANQREKTLIKLGQQIRTKATEEAAKVQPTWKSAVKLVVNIVISVAVIVAIAALAASGVGIVALLGFAALIGAAGGIGKLAANDLIDGKRSSFKDYLKAAGTGALTGILEAVGARAVVGLGGKLGAQMLTKVEHFVASTGVETVTNTLVEMTESMGQGQEFTLKLLGISVASSLVSAVGGKYLDFKFADIGSSAAKGASREATEGVVDGVGDSVARSATRQGLGKEIGQFAAETTFDTAVETGASVARGEELTWGSLGENLAGGIIGRGAAGRADKLYGRKLRNVGNRSTTGDRRSSNIRNVGNRSTTGDRRSSNIRNSDQGKIPTTGVANTRAQNQGDSANNNNSDLSQTVPTSVQRNPDFERVASEGLSRPVEVYSDPGLPGNTVRAEYKRNAQGLVESVHLRAGPNATAKDIELHQHTVKVMRMYGGTLGRVRLVEAKIAKWMGIHGQPQTSSKAWEAQHEVPKLEGVIQERMTRLSTADPSEAKQLEAEVKDLQDQLKEHRRTFEAMDESDGVGYIAAQGFPDGVYTHPDADKLPQDIEEINGRWNHTIKQIKKRLPQEIDNINAKLDELDIDIEIMRQREAPDAKRLEQLETARSNIAGYLNDFKHRSDIPKTKEEYQLFFEREVKKKFDKELGRATRKSSGVDDKARQEELENFQEKYEALAELADPTRKIRQYSLDFENPVVREKFTEVSETIKTKKTRRTTPSKKSIDKGGGSAEVHNHLNGVLDSSDLIELAYEDQRSRLLEEVWQTGRNQNSIEEFYRENGLLEGDSLIPLEELSDRELEFISDQLLAQNEFISFETSYAVPRRVVVDRIEPEKYLEAIIIKQKNKNKTDYFELQGSLPRGVSTETSAKLQAKHGVKIGFLENLSTNSLSVGAENKKYRENLQKITGEPGNPDKQPLELGKDGLVGVDFAGPEAKFTPAGMENFKVYYRLLGQKAKDQDTAVVIRPHVGEGNPNETYEQRKQNATDNIELMITALEELRVEESKRPAEERVSDNIVMRFGHVTHATGNQLDRIKKLGVIVEANLTSNLETGAVENEVQMSQTILKFLYHDVKTIINTDGGGMMKTTLPKEYERAKEAIQLFEDGEISIPIEEYLGASTDAQGNRTAGKIQKTGKVFYKDLSPQEQKRFKINRLHKQSREYKNKIVPRLPI